MNVPELFIRRPVMTTLVMSGILLFGVLGYRLLPVSDLPSVDYPTILGVGKSAGRKSGHHGRIRGHTAGKTVFHHRGH